MLDSRTIDIVTQRLGRRPRGLRAVAVADASGLPTVIRVASVVDGRPFPTLYWLIDPALNYRIDRAEAAGTIAQFQARVDADPALQLAMAEDHRRHIARRASYLTDDERAHLHASAQWPAIGDRGIGGIADFSRIRCLHTWYAAHLVEANTVGGLLDAKWSGQDGMPEASQPQSAPP
jgi:hypothetical protein